MLSHRGGQFLLLASILFAILVLLAIKTLRHPYPRCSSYVGELQSAMLIHAARLYWENRSNKGSLTMDSVLAALYVYNESMKLCLPRVAYTNYLKVDTGLSGSGIYETIYTSPSFAVNGVTFRAKWIWTFQGIYTKRKGVEKKTYLNFTLIYVHEYIAPQWYIIRYSPKLIDYMGDADLEKRDSIWIFGLPSSYNEYLLEDSFGIKIMIRVKG